MLLRDLQINYYTDGGCSSFASSPPNPFTDNSCYNWQISGTNSANIANCDGFSTCDCSFYTQPNCGGASQSASFGGNNCASNWGQGFSSFKCQVA